MKLGLSDKAPDPAEGPSVADLAEQIKAIRGQNTVEAAPQRAESRAAARAEQPVTARIRRKVEEAVDSEDDEVAMGETAHRERIAGGRRAANGRG